MAMRCEVANQTGGLVPANVRREEMLSVQVRVLHDIVVEDAKATNAFTAKSIRNAAANTTGTNEDAISFGEFRLTEADDLFLAMSDGKTRVGGRHFFRLNYYG